MVKSMQLDWVQLLEIDGPFLDPGIVRDAFPHGISNWLQNQRYRRGPVLDAFDEWADQNFPRKLQSVLFDLVFIDALAYPRERFLVGDDVPETLTYRPPEHPGVTLKPDAVLTSPDSKPRFFVNLIAPDQKPRSRSTDSRWSGSPVDAMTELLRHTGAANGVRLGLVTNGQEWSLVHAAPGKTSSVVTWNAALWREEPLTFDSFVALLEDDRFTGVPDDETLAALFERSQDAPKAVTEKLGNQVRQAVEILVAAVDRANRHQNNTLLTDVLPATVYESSVTVMMRLLVLFYAEERGLLPADADYQESYAVSGILSWLDDLSAHFGDDQVLARRFDAWPRLLAAFRAVHGGIDHHELRLPGYGGTLFDPDRFPFLEGRLPGSHWKETPAQPILIDNQTVRHLLTAIQQLEGIRNEGAQRLSFRALDVEQIGHVYERLLDHTAKRAAEPVLGLQGKKGEEPEVPLSRLEAERSRGEDALIEYLKEETGKTEKSLLKALSTPPPAEITLRLSEACNNDETLKQRVLPFASLLRTDRAGRPVVILEESLYVTSGTDRRSSGAHYTPRELTEEIVKHALDPLVFRGPAEGKPEAEWVRKPARELLSLRICDPAMGSGAFLVQACRYLSQHLVDAWAAAEATTGKPVVTPFADLDSGDPSQRPLPSDPDERLAVARRAVVDHCLFGVDVNPLAVEMAKLSLWLITLQKDRPFTFVDHALRCGDALLGIADLRQLRQWSLTPADGDTPRQLSWFEAQLKRAIDEARKLRRQLEAFEVVEIADAERKRDLLAKAEQSTDFLRLGADLLIGAALAPDPRQRESTRQNLLALYSLAGESLRDVQNGAFTALGQQPTWDALAILRQSADAHLDGNRPFHWPLEFPEIFMTDDGCSGFSAFIGNPPFMGGVTISNIFGSAYRNYLVGAIAFVSGGQADLCAFFFRRVNQLMRGSGTFGLIATNSISQGDTREVGLDQLVRQGMSIYRAIDTARWPGEASIQIAYVWAYSGDWFGRIHLRGKEVRAISPLLTEERGVQVHPYRLKENSGISFRGTDVYGMGFVIEPEIARDLVECDARNADVVVPFLNGDDLNSRPDQSPSRWVIDFGDMDEQSARKYREPFEIVERLVKPVRLTRSKQVAAAPWWQHWRKRAELYETISAMKEVLVIAGTSQSLMFARSKTDLVFSNATCVIALDAFSNFAVLQSAVHDAWAREYASTLKGDLRYAPTDCLETFPFPSLSIGLETVGKEFYDARDAVMSQRETGLTGCFHLLNSKHCLEADIVDLRQRLVSMTVAVTSAYHWDDLELGFGFQETKQGVRFTVSEQARVSLLNRLLELNHQRYAEEVAAGLHDKKAASKGGQKRSRSVQPALIRGTGRNDA